MSIANMAVQVNRPFRRGIPSQLGKKCFGYAAADGDMTGSIVLRAGDVLGAPNGEHILGVGFVVSVSRRE